MRTPTSFHRPWAGILNLSVALGIFFVTAAAADAGSFQPISIQIAAGQTQETTIDLGTDGRPDLKLQAELGSRSENWPRNGLSLGLHDGASVRPNRPARQTVTLRTDARGHRLLIVHVASEPCSAPGTHRATVRLSVEGVGPSETIPLPMKIDVAPGRSCEGIRTGAASLGMTVFLIPFAVLLWAKSTLLSTPLLSRQIVPLRSDVTGRHPDATRSGQVRARIAQGFTFGSRLRNWMRSAPLRLLWSAELYREVARITPSDRDLVLRPIPARTLEDPENLAPGLYAQATERGKAQMFLKLDARGCIHGLRPETGLTGRGRFARLRGPVALVRPADDEVTDGPAGWEVRP